MAGGDQPIPNEDESLWIIFNGESHNFPDLYADLVKKGHEFRTRSDTECILHLYEEYGDDCVKHLRGQAALAESGEVVLTHRLEIRGVWREAVHLSFGHLGPSRRRLPPCWIGKLEPVAQPHPSRGNRHQDIAMPIDDDGFLVQLGGSGGGGGVRPPPG